jgi:hypothetical protein
MPEEHSDEAFSRSAPYIVEMPEERSDEAFSRKAHLIAYPPPL